MSGFWRLYNANTQNYQGLQPQTPRHQVPLEGQMYNPPYEDIRFVEQPVMYQYVGVPETPFYTPPPVFTRPPPNVRQSLDHIYVPVFDASTMPSQNQSQPLGQHGPQFMKMPWPHTHKKPGWCHQPRRKIHNLQQTSTSAPTQPREERSKVSLNNKSTFTVDNSSSSSKSSGTIETVKKVISTQTPKSLGETSSGSRKSLNQSNSASNEGLQKQQSQHSKSQVGSVSSLAEVRDDLNTDTVMDIYMKIWWKVQQYITPCHYYMYGMTEQFTLSQNIWHKYLDYQEPIKNYFKKIIIWKKMYLLLKTKNSDYDLFLTGSTLSGLSDSNTDLNLYVKAPSRTGIPEHFDNLFHLTNMQSIFKSMKDIEGLRIIETVIPSLKLTVLNGLPVMVDITCNNSIALANSALLYGYTRCDWRLKPLYNIIKLWARHHSLTGKVIAMISGYTLQLLLIFFLQCGVSPPVLPCLQRIDKDNFDFENLTKVGQLDLFRYWSTAWISCNCMSLGELLIAFFTFYDDFDFTKNVISVRLGTPVLRTAYNHIYQNSLAQKEYVFVEEPFTRKNTSTLIHFNFAYLTLKKHLNAARSLLENTMDLNSIFSYQ
ncbi:poly(A) RNA polymerase gld-2 homolog A-like [Lycorma delicatula]|uniref:poly(A) RNA polymerase gld-2 homolog A-like n=1 Tax=Lycorma delicatula TaxID=130591 RepID=UPI003F50F024